MTATLFSNRYNAPLHLGKPPASPLTIDHVKFADILAEVSSSVVLPPVPQNFGHGLVFGYTNWGMDGNGPAGADTKIPAGFAARQGAGDCFYAGCAHDIRETAKVNGNPVPPISDYTVIKQYATGVGYDPRSGSGDNGTDVQVGLAARQTNGFYDDNGKVYKIGQVVALEPGNLTELFYAAYLFEKAGVGVRFQQAQMDQFDAGQAWRYVPGSPEEGGHWIIVVSRNGLITWGCRSGYVADWYTNLNDESFAWTDPLEVNRVTGQSAEHFSQQDLAKYVTLVAQQKAAVLGLS